MEITKDTLKTITIEDIMQYCQEQGEDAVRWLVELGKTTVKTPIYPTKVVVNKKGEAVEKADKKAEPIGYKEERIPYVNIKGEFIKKFFPELAPKPKAAKKQSMWDKIAALEATLSK